MKLGQFVKITANTWVKERRRNEAVQGLCDVLKGMEGHDIPYVKNMKKNGCNKAVLALVAQVLEGPDPERFPAAYVADYQKEYQRWLAR